MADKRDFYEVLGVAKTASDAEIKSAFRKKAKEFHPDLHPGDAECERKFKEVNEAYEVLSSADKRQKYDQFGHAAFDPTMGGGSGSPFTGGFGGFGDIFDQVFGGGFGGYSNSARNGPVPGNDLRYSLTLSFEEAAFGVKKEILIPREESCSTCSGTGAKPGTEVKRCTTCGGTGQVRTQQQTMFGSFASSRPCSVCKGTGKIISEPCTDCRGTGRVRKNKRISINIPAGIDNGQVINMRGEGEDGLRGGERGDLYVNINVRPHKLFQRDGYDLYLEMPIPFTTAALGGQISVPTLKEPVKYEIPAGTQSGTTFRLRGQGVQRCRREGSGDLLVKVSIDVPKRLNDEQKKLLEALSQTLDGGSTPRPAKKGIFSKVKDAFEG